MAWTQQWQQYIRDKVLQVLGVPLALDVTAPPYRAQFGGLKVAVALQGALDDAHNNGGGIVQCPMGGLGLVETTLRMYHDTTLVIPSGCILRAHSTLSGAMIAASGGSYHRITGGGLIDGQSIGAVVPLVHLTSCTDAFLDVYFTGYTGTAVQQTNCVRAKVGHGPGAANVGNFLPPNDGTSDDTAAFQAATNFIEDTGDGRGSIFIPRCKAGVYYNVTNWNFDDIPAEIIGEGAQASILKLFTDTGPILHANHTTSTIGMLLRDFGLIGSGTTTPATNHGIVGNNWALAVLQDIEIDSCQHGIHVTNVNTSDFRGIIYGSNNSTGLYEGAGCFFNRHSDEWYDENKATGLDEFGLQNSFSNCQFDDNTARHVIIESTAADTKFGNCYFANGSSYLTTAAFNIHGARTTISGGTIETMNGPYDVIIQSDALDTVFDHPYVARTASQWLVNSGSRSMVSYPNSFVQVTASTALTIRHGTVISSGLVTQTLPLAQNLNAVITVVRNDGANNTVVHTVASNGFNGYGGAVTKTLGSNGAALTAVADGSNGWWIQSTVGTVT